MDRSIGVRNGWICGFCLCQSGHTFNLGLPASLGRVQWLLLSIYRIACLNLDGQIYPFSLTKNEMRLTTSTC